MSHLAVHLIFRFQRIEQQKKVIINLKNEDDECLKWAITRALKPVEINSERIDRNLRETSNTFNWEGLKFSVNLSDIINLKIIILQFLLMYSVMKRWLILLE